MTLRYYTDRIAVQGKCPRPQFMKGMVKNMKQQPEKNYWENRRNLQAAADELLSHMKGHDWSFRREITDRKEDFSQEKLLALLDEMLSGWEDDLREGRFEDIAEPYIDARKNLLRHYLYLVMRCSLCRGAYSDVCSGAGEKERTDFAFLLEQARRFFNNWCVVTGPDGKRRNEPCYGYDRLFGFHLYFPFNEFASGQKGPDFSSLLPDWKQPYNQSPRFWTDEGRHKPIDIKHLGKGPMVRPRPEEQEEESDDGLDYYDPLNDHDPSEDYDPSEDFDFWDSWENYESNSEAYDREERLRVLWMNFECLAEYLSACEEFKKCFEQAAPEVIWDFCENLEAIVDLFLLKREIPPLTDTDKSQDVYTRFRDGALRLAKRCGRGIQWKGL